MKKLTTLFLLALFTLSYTATTYSRTKNPPVAQGEKSLGSFKGIAAGGPLNVKVTIGNTESIRFEGNREAIAELVTEIMDGVLTVKPKTKWNEWSRKYNRTNVTVYINAKKISSLTMSGSGTLEVDNVINGSELVTTLSGSGSIKGTTNVKSYTGVLSGSGNIILAGKSDDANFTISGSGSFNGKGFSVKKAAVQISGSADASFKATESIDAVISGSGSVNYSGDPMVKKTIIGSGRVSKS